MVQFMKSLEISFPSKNHFLFTIFCLFIFQNYLLFADGNCPNLNNPDVGSAGIRDNYHSDNNVDDVVIQISYSSSNNNTYEIIMDWSTLYFHNPDNWTLNSMKEADLKKMLIKSAISRIGSKTQPQENDIQTFIFYEQTDCKITTKCWIMHDYYYQELCHDTDWGIGPSFIPYDGQFYSAIETTTICGTKCCQSVYTVQWVIDLYQTDRIVPKILSKITNTVTGTECNYSEIDCLTGEIINCGANCE